MSSTRLIISSFIFTGLLGNSVGTVTMETPAIVRREPRSDGRLVELRQHAFEASSNPNHTVRINAAIAAAQGSDDFDAASTAEWPKFEFPKGEKGTNNCALGNHTRMHHPDICKYAAGIAPGARLPKPIIEGDFLIKGDNAKSTHPVGCFAEPCGSEVCYYWNEYDGTPDATAIPSDSTPICMRVFYAYGTATASDVSNGCPGGYTAIMDHDDCLAEGELLGYGPASPFRTGATEHCIHDEYGAYPYSQCSHDAKEKHRDHPIGCYLDSDSSEVHYNFVEDGPDGEDYHYANPDGPNGITGTPICKVATTTSWP